ncbi:MAG: sensor histidine kinase [Prevotella sp.]
MDTFKRYLITALILLLNTALANADKKTECDRYRKEIATVDSASVQSYIAQVNKQRAANQVAQQKLRNNRQRNILMTSIVAGGLLVTTLLAMGLIMLRRYNRRLKESEQRLSDARRMVENSVRLKNLFLSNMSHEIRTPLNALAGFSAILADNSVDDESRKQFECIIQQNSDLLMKLINDVVDFSNQQNGEMQFRLERHDAVEICRNVVKTVDKVKQTKATISFTSDLDSLPITTDEARLQQLLINLLVNANKFTKEGSITLSLTTGDDGMAHFAVTDTGCGIAPDKREQVFNRFEKINENAQGTGLGLSICRYIIERLGGRIWVDPDYDKGARFCFTHRLVSIALLLLATFGSYAKTAEEIKVDSMRKEAKAMPHGEERLQKLSELVTVSQLMPDGIKDAHLMLEEAKYLKNDTSQANALAYIVNHHYMYDETVDSVVYWANHGMEVASKCGSWRMYFEMQYTLINSYIFNGRYEYALDESVKMLDEATRQKNFSGITKAYVTQAQIYIGTYRWHEADEVIRKAHKTMYKEDDLQIQFTVLMHLLDYSILVHNFERMDKALDEIDIIMDKMLKMAPGMEITLNDHRLFVEYCHILYCSYKHDFLKAAAHEAKGKHFYERLSYPPYKPLYLYALCFNRIEREMLDEAMQINMKAMKLSEEINVRTSNKIFCLTMQADILYKQKRYGEALAIYKRLKHTTDSISSAMSKEQIDELQKISHINNLKAEEEKLKAQNATAVMVLIGIVMTVLIAIMARLALTHRRLKRTESQTANALDESKENNRQKERFFNTMSQAIRTPLREVMDMSRRMVEDTSLTVEQRSRMADNIRSHTDRLMYLVTGVLDLSRLESGMTKWQVSTHDFIAVCRDAIAKASAKWPSARYSLDTDIEEYPCDIDAPRLQQVIESQLTGTIDLQDFEGDVRVIIRSRGDSLHLSIEGSPLVSQPQNETTQLRQDINRLTLAYFPFIR